MSASHKLLRLDLALFVATASAIAGYYRYQQRKPVRRASTKKHVSFREEDDPETIISSVSLPMIEELRTSSKARRTPILGVLFAAAWCPDCSTSGAVSAVGRIAAETSRSIDIVYVSSDASEAELVQFKPRSMRHIPFDDVELRTALKKQFRTCAAKEADQVLGPTIPRMHGLPTLVLFDTGTGRVLTANGVDDVMNAESPAQVLRQWKAMLE